MSSSEDHLEIRISPETLSAISEKAVKTILAGESFIPFLQRLQTEQPLLYATIQTASQKVSLYRMDSVEVLMLGVFLGYESLWQQYQADHLKRRLPG